jgi:hypothetical protein
MGIEDIQISEELETNAPSIKYRGNEGPKSPQEMEKMIMASLEEEYAKYVFEMQEQGLEPMSMQRFIEQAMAEGQMSGGQPLPNDPTKPVNPFQPKPTGPVLPDRQMAAYGGIMGMDGRKQYGIGSWFQEKIMDPIKENPLLAATAAYLGYDTYQNKSDLGESILGKGLGQITKERTRKDAKGEDETYTIGGDVAGLIGKNIIPIAGGIGAGLFTKNTESDTPGLPDDTTGIQLADLKKTANLLDQKQGMAAGLNFLPTVASRKYTPAEMIDVYQTAANGGRIGFDNGGGIMMASSDMGDPKENAEYYSQRMFGKPYKELNADELEEFQEEMRRLMNKFMSNGGRINRAEGGIMDLGGMEKDYRAEGGFVPIGKAEKADDVPARLSVNEFVFTADAVRNAGGGDIDQGAKVMENMMKHLEQGGQVSEESQGMQGARDMFATSQRLGDVI